MRILLRYTCINPHCDLYRKEIIDEKNIEGVGIVKEPIFTCKCGVTGLVHMLQGYTEKEKKQNLLSNE